MIQVEDLTKDYGLRRAINHLTFNAKRGEILGFLGPNGAGKTTTMRILTGFLSPSNGKVTIGGFDAFEQSLQVRKIIGYLPETVPLYNEMTVFSYLKFMGDLRHLAHTVDRVHDVIKVMHLEDRTHGIIGNLSKGMRQRVGLAQALLHQPEVLILDEPTIGLDPVQIKEVRELIRSIGKERTVLLSTHILSEAQQLCDRVLIINHGEIVVEDSPASLQHRLSGTLRISIKVRCDGSSLPELIKSIPGVEDLTVTNDCQVEFNLSGANDPRPQVARKIFEAGFDLLEMKEISLSLEDIFLELTRDDVKAPEMTNVIDSDNDSIFRGGQ